ncbi:MAG TPA: amino acid adenylation domain-containing protein [Herpetosiphonaceae bacterium]
MTIVELLTHLRQLNVEVWLEDDRLRYRAPIGVLTPDLRALLSQHKAEIIAFLNMAQRERRDAGPIPLSFAQQRLWFLDQLQPNSTGYTIPMVVRLTGTLDVAALHQSCNAIIRRHEILRTTFTIKDGQPVQVIAPAGSEASQLQLTQIDLSGVPQSEQDTAVQRVLERELQQPFDLQRGPLLRATLLHLHRAPCPEGTRHGTRAEQVVMLMLHHIIFDAWSQPVFIAELNALYTHFSRPDAAERPLPLPELPLQYADYAQWQNRWLREAGLEQQLDYWRQQLHDLPVLQLMTDRPRPANLGVAGRQYHFGLPDECAAALHRLSQGEGCTIFMTLLAAWQVLLARSTAQSDIVVGTPIANRTQAETQKLIGFFVNTLVLRTDLSGNPTFREALHRVREVCLAAYAHQEVPFDTLVDELHAARDLSRHPLFQVMFAYQHSSGASPAWPQLKMELVPIEIEQVKFDLNLTIDETRAGLTGTLKYRTELFDEGTIARMAGQLQVLLTAISSDPDVRIFHLPLMTPAEYHDLLHSCHASATYAVEHGLHHAFEQQAARTPEAVAVTDSGICLTYAELNRRSNQLAHHLQTLGVGPEVCVGVLVERSLDLIIGLLGILKAGGAYVPLDPALPPERLAFMLRDARAAVLVSQTPLSATLPAHTLPVVQLDADAEIIAGYPGTAPERSVLPDHPAYVIYTSGSTGTPKGVLVTHANVLRLFAATQDCFAFDARDVWTLFHSAAFDFSVWEIWGALLYGGKLVIVPYVISRSPAGLYQLLCTEGVTVLNQTPSAFRQLIPVDTATGDGDLALRLVIFGGEALDLQSLRPWFDRHGDIRPQLVNMYGITETTVHVTYRPLTTADLQQSASVIGGAISDLEVYLLDRYLQPVPVGVPGEIYVGGAGLAHGYLDRPALTAERFVPHPFSSARSGERLYKSGDLARYRANGELEYLGRIDQQVKVRGFRIELGEIQSRLLAHPAVSEAVVIAREDTSPGGHPDRRLVAYVVENLEPRTQNQEPGSDLPPRLPQPRVPCPEGARRRLGEIRGRGAGGEGLAPELRRFLQASLPEYMIPAAFVTLESLPLTANGKLDRNALPIPDQERPALDAAYTAPRSALEQFLVERWQDVLAVTTIGVHDNFFALGGNSIQAAVLVNQIQTAMQEIIYVVAIFDAPTVAELAVYLSNRYPQAVARIDGSDGRSQAPAVAEASKPSRTTPIGLAEVSQLQQLITALPPRVAGASSKNPPAVFILSPPRSGSTLLRVMLAGHPRLFAPPELELLSFNTLGERKAAFTGRDRFWLEGAIRAIMALNACDAATAEQLMAQYEAQGLSVQAFYRQLQTWLGDRLLVDKTPSYALDRAILDRAEEDFANARYIHLIRHPYGMIRSFEEARLDEIVFRRPHPFTTRELAELIWLISHQNILDFFAQIPAERRHTIWFEELVREPAQTMERLCTFLGVDLDPAMLQPYADSQQRMTDGPHAASRMLGDVKFHEHQGIEAATSERWRDAYTEDFLGDLTWQLAERLGYARPQANVPTTRPDTAWTPIHPQPRTGNDRFPCSFAQQRLWFIDQLQPNSPMYNIFFALRLTGSLDRLALQHSFDALIQRHESLRTVFMLHEGAPVQVIAPPQPAAITMIDLRTFPAAEREAAAKELATGEACSPFDLGCGPLLRVLLLQLDADDHLLVMNIHHIVSDGWSQRVLIREVTTLYAAYARGVSAANVLPSLGLQYADYAVWQRDWLQGPALATQVAYWQQQLADLPTLDLPTDYPRPAIQTANGGHCGFVLPPELSQDLVALSRREGVTLFMLLLAAFQTLLMRYTGQEDIVVGTPIAGRVRPELEALIGFFVNTLVLRTDLSGRVPSGCRFREVLQRVRTITAEAYAHQDVPFEVVVEQVQPARDLSRHPLFQVMFILQNFPSSAIDVADLAFEPVALESSTAKFDLTMMVAETPDGLHGAVEYASDLFDAATIVRLIEHYQRVLVEIAADPDQSIAALPLLSAAERRQLVGEWNRTALDVPADVLVHHLVAAQAARTPEALAVVFGEQRLSYAAFDRRANQLAHRLRQHGVGPDVCVALAIERSLDLAVAVLSVLKAGGACLPLDPAYPVDRLRFMLSDSGAPVLLTHSTLADRLPLTAAQVLTLDTLTDLDGYAPTPPAIAVEPEHLAYVLYTSGSTGTPKAVAMPHGALVNLATWQRNSTTVASAATTLQFAALSFDVAFQEMFATWTSGGTLQLISEAERQDLAALVSLLATGSVQRIFLPYIALQHMAEFAVQEQVQLHGVQEIVTAGEQLQITNAIAQVVAALPGATLHNHYGPTETHAATAHVLDGDPARWPALPPIGKPISNTAIYLLDQLGQVVPIGVAGELYIGGAQLARGYLNRPDLTAERFVPNPFSATPGTRLYRTGDRARYRADGTIEYLGRIDQQVKVRGFRVEVGEIEAALRLHPAVGDVVVTVRELAASEGGPAEKRLAAYVVLKDDAPLPGAAQPARQAPGVLQSAFRTFLHERLPEYMIPAAFVLLEALPLTPSGKINRRALPAPDARSLASATSQVAPRDVWEWSLAQIWEDLLHLPQVSVHDDFFALGGHSLLAVRAMAEIRHRFGRSLPVATLLQSPTIARLAAHLRAHMPPEEWSPLVPLQPQGSQRPLFLIHPGSGTVFCYAELARALGTDQPCYGLQARGFEPDQTPHRTIPDLAAEYIAAIRSVQPHGPYRVGGWSFGGVVAFEIASRLQQQGEPIEVLTLIDSVPPVPELLVPDDTSLLGAFLQDLGAIHGTSLEVTAADLALLPANERLAYVLARAQQQEVLPPDIDLEQMQRRAQVFLSNMSMLLSYRPAPTPLPVVCLMAEATAQRTNPAESWRSLTTVITSEVMPGTHYTLLRPPQVQAVADWLGAQLAALPTIS